MTGKLDECVFQIVRAGISQYALHSVIHDQFSMVDDGDFMCDALDFVHVVSREEYCELAFIIELLQICSDMIAGLRVKSHSRFVQE